MHRLSALTDLLKHLLKWLLLASVVAVLAGSASAAFLFALDWATRTRLAHAWLIWLLPVAGFVVGWLYLRYGSSVEGGANLLIDEIHDPKKIIPLRMAPLVLGGTVVSHLFGASVGREGTAVQMGGALADQLTRMFRLNNEDRRIILMAGISAGFASVFGTPLAGALFGLEVLAIGRLRYEAMLPCLAAAVIADQVVLLWGPFLHIAHTHYAVPLTPAISAWTLSAMVIAGVLFGVTGKVFAQATHGLSALMKRKIAYAPLRPLIGGLVVALAVWLLGTDRYIGLGIPTIVDALKEPLAAWDFLGKMAFTIVSLGTGFKGGEVTPLFFIGATLGNALGPLLHQPVTLLAAIGFVAVFAGAANTPIASTLMAMELFGAEIGVYAAIACVVAYLFSGHAGIYRAQRSGHAKRTTREEVDP
ncbi:voltage-gated chloride channel family protein [Janthinobacterium sp. SUN026]|uniref:voltage-gated chloride channel family protein n=1 Tax=Janthinobacterium sp. SUN026 TaxID=3002438 RepID=UPI0025AF9BBC|nr:voltage-gated chloride channel family protein [Janthinobacterium sp. SUN026]MDN2672343.1 voltage-gated chloride channel family protein [Janthinobacterium sp. SUN026]